MNEVDVLRDMIAYPKVCLNDLKTGPAKGSYILIAKLDVEKEIPVGSLGVVTFQRGFYAYLGSALGGFKSRINRHLTKSKLPKWHIDYLLNEASLLQVFLCDTERRLECLLSRVMIDEISFIPAFGSSDCRCQSHLYFANDKPSLQLGIRKAVTEVALPYESFKEMIGFWEKNWLL